MKRERYALRRDACVLKSGPCGVYQPASSAEEIVAKGIMRTYIPKSQIIHFQGGYLC